VVPQHLELGADDRRPLLRLEGHANASAHSGEPPRARLIRASHHALDTYWLACQGRPDLCFTENESNILRLWGIPNRAPFVKDSIHDAVIGGATDAVNPDMTGTKVAAHYSFSIPPGESRGAILRLSSERHDAPFADADRIFDVRRMEADAFYAPFAPEPGASDDAALVQRQAFAELLWSKQWYSIDIDTWLDGDPAGPKPPESRRKGRNSEWRHLNNADVISMPDTWEYPWYAAWDLAFHCIPLALADPDFAKEQLINLVREWYMHPNGQLPAYEWNFNDVNPPVHAWAAWRVYNIEQKHWGVTDRAFLESVFHKLLLNFTW
jgi:hypothetical protein